MGSVPRLPRLPDSQTPPDSPKKVALYFIHRYSGLSNTEIGKIFGGIHFSTISKASFRLKEEMAEDKGLARLVMELDSNFKA